MKTINEFFNDAELITGSDRQTALRIGVSPNRISMARKSGSMSNEFCALLAEVINANPLEIIAAAEVKKHPEKTEFWKKWLAQAEDIRITECYWFSGCQRADSRIAS